MHFYKGLIVFFDIFWRIRWCIHFRTIAETLQNNTLFLRDRAPSIGGLSIAPSCEIPHPNLETYRPSMIQDGCPQAAPIVRLKITDHFFVDFSSHGAGSRLAPSYIVHREWYTLTVVWDALVDSKGGERPKTPNKHKKINGEERKQRERREVQSLRLKLS